MLKLLFFTWLVQAAPALMLFIPAWYFRRDRLQLYWQDYGLFVIPWLAWMLVSLIGIQPKTLSNAVIDPMLLGVMLAFLFVFRVFLAKHFNQQVLAKVILLSSVLVSLAIYLFVPILV